MGGKTESLHDHGRTELVSAEQAMQVVAALGDIGANDAKWVPIQVSALLMRFQAVRLIDGRFQSLVEHRENLKKIYNTSFELSALLRNEIGSNRLILGDDYVSQYSIHDSISETQVFFMFLNNVKSNSAAALADEQFLAEMRYDQKPNQGKKSFERRHLWEPLFEIWLSCHGSARFSEGGPLEKMIVSAHMAVGIALPNSNTLKRALIDWRKTQGMQPL